MFNGGNDFTMPVVPAGYANNGNNGGWGGDGAWWIIVFVLFFAFGGWGNGGWGGNGSGLQGALTRGDLCQDMNFSDLESAVGRLSDNQALQFTQLNNGLCNLGYQNAQLINGVQMQVANEFRGTDNAICNLGFQTQQGFNNTNIALMQGQNALATQIADCCCKNQTGQMQLANTIESGFCNANYNNATSTNAIIQNAHNDTDRIIARIDAAENARKDETIADLRTKLAACGDQTTAQYIINQLTGIISPRAVPAYPAASPCGLGNWNPNVLANGYYGYGYNNNCGCNNGCCGCNG